MTLKNDEKFEEKLTCGLKNDMDNLDNFHQSAIKSKNWHFDGILFFKAENSWTYRGVMCLDNEEWCKIWRGTDLMFQYLHEKFDEVWSKH